MGRSAPIRERRPNSSTLRLRKPDGFAARHRAVGNMLAWVDRNQADWGDVGAGVKVPRRCVEEILGPAHDVGISLAVGA